MDRRQAIKSGLAGALTLWAAPLMQAAQQTGGVRTLTDSIAVLDSGGSNVIALSSDDGFALVDTGVPGSADRLRGMLKGLGGSSRVHTVFNTHYHLPQTGNNEVFAAAGATIVAHDRTRQWMSVDRWLNPSET